MEIIKNTANVFATGFRAVLTTYAWNFTVQRVSFEFGTPFDRGRKESEKEEGIKGEERKDEEEKERSLPRGLVQALYAKLVKKPRRFIRRASIEIGPAYDRRWRKTPVRMYRFVVSNRDRVEGNRVNERHVCA